MNIIKDGLVVDECGNRFWYYDGLLHREDGPAVEMNSGEWEWLFHGIWHRVGGPAIKSGLAFYWYDRGKIHRANGPAVEWHDGRSNWYYRGKRVECSSNEEFNKLIKFRAFW
jgi:hypothetical protein